MIHFNIQNIIIEYCNVDDALKLYNLDKEDQKEKLYNTYINLFQTYKKIIGRTIKNQFNFEFPNEKIIENEILNPKIIQAYINFHKINKIINFLIKNREVRLRYCLKNNIIISPVDVESYKSVKNSRNPILAYVCNKYSSWFDNSDFIPKIIRNLNCWDKTQLCDVNTYFNYDGKKYVVSIDTYSLLKMYYGEIWKLHDVYKLYYLPFEHMFPSEMKEYKNKIGQNIQKINEILSTNRLAIEISKTT